MIRLLCATEADLYDWPVDGDEAGELLVDAARPGYRQVAATLRQKILAGELAPGTAIPANSALAAEFGVSMSLANAAMTQLASEGLVRVAHGRPTVVLARRAFAVTVTVPPKPGHYAPAGDDPSTPGGRLLDFAAAVSAVASVEVSWRTDMTEGKPPPPAAVLSVTVLAGTLLHAAAVAVGIAGRALGGDDNWDLDGASVEAHPAGETGKRSS